MRRYRRGRILFADALSEAHEATFRDEDGVERRVLLQLLGVPVAEGSAEEARFFEECERLRGLEGEPLVPLLDHGRADEDHLYTASAFVEGRHLGELLDEHKEGLPTPIVARLGLDLLAALERLHGEDPPRLHRGLSPRSVILDLEGRARLSDLGIGALWTSAASKKTAANTVLCSYTSAEQIKGQAATPASDLFSLGSVLYQGLSGRRPFSASTPLATAVKVSMGKADPLAALAPEAPAALTELIHALLARSPAERPEAAAIREVLEACLESREDPRASLVLFASGGEETQTERPQLPSAAERPSSGLLPALSSAPGSASRQRALADRLAEKAAPPAAEDLFADQTAPLRRLPQPPKAPSVGPVTKPAAPSVSAAAAVPPAPSVSAVPAVPAVADPFAEDARTREVPVPLEGFGESSPVTFDDEDGVPTEAIDLSVLEGREPGLEDHATSLDLREQVQAAFAELSAAPSEPPEGYDSSEPPEGYDPSEPSEGYAPTTQLALPDAPAIAPPATARASAGGQAPTQRRPKPPAELPTSILVAFGAGLLLLLALVVALALYLAR